MGIIAPPLGQIQLPAPTGNATIDTENLQNYVNNAGSNKSFDLQAGEYLLNKLRLKHNQKLRGRGKGITTLKLANGQNVDLISNEAEGEGYITLADMTVDGNKANQAGTKNHHGVHLIQSPSSTLENIEAQNVDGHGISLDGNGTITRYHQLYNIIVHDNAAFGYRGTFALRNAEYVNITAYKNGEHGIQFDHSELVATNIESRENEGRGVFIRNIFTGVFNDFRATLNGEDGIYVQGMVFSIGNNWFAGGNSTKTENTYNEVTFNGSGALSYGISNEAIINNLQANPNSELGNKSKHCLFIGDPEAGPTTFGSLKILGNFGTGKTGSIRIPAEANRGNLGIWDWPSATSNLRLWTGGGIASPNGMLLGTANTHLLGFFGATPVGQQTLAVSQTNSGAFKKGAQGFETEAEASAVIAKLEALVTASNKHRTALKNLGLAV